SSAARRCDRRSLERLCGNGSRAAPDSATIGLSPRDEPSMASENDSIIAAWNTVLFDKFQRFKHLLIQGLSAHSDEALARHAHPQGARVIDVGCGFGDSAQKIAQTVGASGAVVGVDCAERFVAVATEDARSAGIDNVSFAAADVQTDDLRGPYDFAFSRFGTMFCNMPGAAMRNVRRSMKPRGMLTMIVW